MSTPQKTAKTKQHKAGSSEVLENLTCWSYDSSKLSSFATNLLSVVMYIGFLCTLGVIVSFKGVLPKIIMVLLASLMFSLVASIIGISALIKENRGLLIVNIFFNLMAFMTHILISIIINMNIMDCKGNLVQDLEYNVIKTNLTDDSSVKLCDELKGKLNELPKSGCRSELIESSPYLKGIIIGVTLVLVMQFALLMVTIFFPNLLALKMIRLMKSNGNHHTKTVTKGTKKHVQPQAITVTTEYTTQNTKESKDSLINPKSQSKTAVSKT